MNSYVAISAVVVALCVFVKNGEALQCWNCVSDGHGNCADYFNRTALTRVNTIYNNVNNYPRIETCPYALPNQKYVCMKKVQRNKRYDSLTYIRQCHALTLSESVGSCPSETSYGDLSIDYCEFCDGNECNAATGLTKFAIWFVLPLALYLGLRK